jgi:hypothetical protein
MVVVVCPSFVVVVEEEPSALSVVVVTLPSASVLVEVLLPSLYSVTQVFTLLAVVHVGPLVTVLDGGAAVVVAHTPAPAVTLQ